MSDDSIGWAFDIAGQGPPSGRQTCGGYGSLHDAAAHGLHEPNCEHEWSEYGTPDDPWRECWLCGRVEDL